MQKINKEHMHFLSASCIREFLFVCHVHQHERVECTSLIILYIQTIRNQVRIEMNLQQLYHNHMNEHVNKTKNKKACRDHQVFLDLSPNFNYS